MVVLIGYLWSGLVAVIASVMALFGRKVIVATLSVSALLACTVIFTLALNSILTSITNSLSFPEFLTPMLWFVPSNFPVVVSAIISGHVARAVYDFAMDKIHLVNSST